MKKRAMAPNAGSLAPGATALSMPIVHRTSDNSVWIKKEREGTSNERINGSTRKASHDKKNIIIHNQCNHKGPTQT